MVLRNKIAISGDRGNLTDFHYLHTFLSAQLITITIKIVIIIINLENTY